MGKRDIATESFRTMGWYRQLQQEFFGEVTESPDAPKLIKALDDIGVTLGDKQALSKATLGRWFKGTCRPSAKLVQKIAEAISLADFLNSKKSSGMRIPTTAKKGETPCPRPKLTSWWDQFDLRKKAVQDDQIRLLSFIDIWAMEDVEEMFLIGLLHSIVLDWEPKKIGKLEPEEYESTLRWEINFRRNEKPVGRIRPELSQRADFTSIIVFLMSLANLDWPSQEQALRNSPYVHNCAFSAWCVDTIGSCMLIDRLYQKWGDTAYTRSTLGIDVAAETMGFVFPRGKNYLCASGNPDYCHRISRCFKSLGVPVDNDMHFYQVFSSLAELIHRMLEECGASIHDVLKMRNRVVTNYPLLPKSAK